MVAMCFRVGALARLRRTKRLPNMEGLSHASSLMKVRHRLLRSLPDDSKDTLSSGSRVRVHLERSLVYETTDIIDMIMDRLLPLDGVRI